MILTFTGAEVVAPLFLGIPKEQGDFITIKSRR
jgi:hypothetical protein